MCPRSGFTELRLARSGESLAGGPGLNWAGSRRSAWINVAGNEAAEDLNNLWPRSQNSARHLSALANTYLGLEVNAPCLPGTISVATIRFAGQPSCAALRIGPN